MTRTREISAIAAGLVSGVTLAVFAAVAQLLAGEPLSTTYIFLAADLGGPTIGSSPAAVPIGVLVLFAGTTGWAFGYVNAARRQPQLLTRPVISGAVFGFIVWFVMQLVLVTAARWTPISVYSFYRDLIAFTLFFGIPLAFTAARVQGVK